MPLWGGGPAPHSSPLCIAAPIWVPIPCLPTYRYPLSHLFFFKVPVEDTGIPCLRGGWRCNHPPTFLYAWEGHQLYSYSTKYHYHRRSFSCRAYIQLARVCILRTYIKEEGLQVSNFLFFPKNFFFPPENCNQL